MKVLICARGYNSKTAHEVGFFELDQAKALKAAGCDVRIVSLDLRSPRRRRPFGAQRFSLEKMRCVTVNYYGSILPGEYEDKIGRLAAKKAYSLICKDGWEPDIIHAHFTEIASAFADVASKSKAKFVITEHSSAMNRSRPDAKSLRQAKYAYPRADKVVSVSTALAKAIAESTGVKAVVIGNTVDTSVFSGLSTGSDNGHFRFVSCGNLVEIKRFDLLLKAFARIEDNTAQLTIFGDGVQEGALKALSSKLGISGRVVFRGRHERSIIAAEYARSDAFVLASRSETFGVSFLEAMCMGLPVVGTRCGGPEDFVSDVNGRLAEINDIGSLAEQMDFVQQHRNEFDSLKIKELVYEKYSPAGVAHRLKELYSSMLGNA